MNMPEAGGTVWKWIAASLVAVLLVVASGTTATAIALLSTPDAEQFELVKERQQIVLQRLAAQDALMSEMLRRIQELQDELRLHDESDLPRR